MTEDQHLWACALYVEKGRGERATEFVAERVRTLAATGDLLGVHCWQAISDKFDQLRAGSPSLQ